ncbi:MAG: glycerate kinase [Pseudomonadota bacterium]
MTPPITDQAAFLRALFDAAVTAADPMQAVAEVLPERPAGRVLVVGAGKASARLAQAVEAVWGACEGLVIVPHGARLSTKGIELVEAAHPVPDEAGATAARRILSMVSALGEGDLALCLISGGGSSLMPVPVDGVSLSDKQEVNRALLRSGASIDEINTVRKQLSAIKGGKLAAAAAPAQVVTLTISDIPGDDPGVIASGPTVANDTTPEDALAIVARYGIDLPPQAAAALERARVRASITLKGADRLHMVARPQTSLEAAAEVARRAGVAPLILGDALEGEAAVLGQVMAGIASQVRRHGQPVAAPAVLISGGETTVTVQGEAGRGGRNSEFLLGFALEAWAWSDVAALACDTDGRDGSEHNAGALWLPEMAERIDRRDAQAALAGHDAYTFFEKVGGLVETGPTHTNVNDFRAVLILPR